MSTMSGRQELGPEDRQKAVWSLPLRLAAPTVAAASDSQGVASVAALVPPGFECGPRGSGSPLGQRAGAPGAAVVHQAMVRDVPPVFSGTVEINETYLGGTWRNKSG